MDLLASGNQLYLYESYGDAAKAYNKAISKLMGADQFGALFGRAKCRMATRDFGLAVTDLLECVSLQPKHQLANYYLGFYLMKQHPTNYKTLQKCRDYLQTALAAESKKDKKDSRFEDALNKLNKKLENLPKPEAAVGSNAADTTVVTGDKSGASANGANGANGVKTEEKESESVASVANGQNGVTTGSTGSSGSSPDSVKKTQNVREGWYQTQTNVIYTLYIKNLTKDDVVINFDANSVEFELNLPNTEKFQKRLNLFGTIVPEKSRFTVTKFKVNCTLQKADGLEWKDLEKVDTKEIEKHAAAGPWNSKKNWDEVGSFAAQELEKEKPEGDEALQSLFQKIYKDADDDQRRAMVKSFQTSGGTVLSTNWGDVKNKDYEGKDKVLPTGQDVKKWEY